MKIAPALALLFLTVLFVPPVYARVGDQHFQLLSNDRAFLDLFGWSVAIDGDLAVVSALSDDDNGNNSGSAYVFDAATGVQLAKLLAADGASGDFFGVSVGISGNTVIVGASREGDDFRRFGSAYLFDATTGAQTAKLSAGDMQVGHTFGGSVAIDGNTAIVGALGDDDRGDDAGSAYLFDVTTGNQLAKLTASDGDRNDSFGNAVAISGNRAIVGAYQDEVFGSNSGSAYLFDTITGQQLAKFLPPAGSPGDQFGKSVAISGNTAIVGVPIDEDNGEKSGSAYLFDATTGELITKLTPREAQPFDQFGWSVAINGNTAIVGARYYDSARLYGSAYLFDVASGEQLARLLPGEGEFVNFEFGYSVDISEDMAIVGATRLIGNFIRSGGAYLYSTIPEPNTLWLAALAAAHLLLRRRS